MDVRVGTIKKAERRRIDAFELWCWRRLWRVPWTARRPNQSILKKISPEYSLEGLILKLNLRYSGHLMWRTDSFERSWCQERLKVGGEGDDRGWDDWMAALTWWTWVWVSSGSWWWTGSLACCSPWRCKELTQRLNWTKLNCPWQTAASRGSQRLPVIPLSKEELWFCEGQNGNFRDWKMRPCSWVENDLSIWTISLPCSVLSCITPCSHSPPALPSLSFSSFSQDLRDFTSLRSYSLVAEGASRKRKAPRSDTKDSHTPSSSVTRKWHSHMCADPEGLAPEATAL